MNRVIVDLPERLQSNAFALWMEVEGFDIFQKYYAEKMPDERQPKSVSVEFDENDGFVKHSIVIE